GRRVGGDEAFARGLLAGSLAPAPQVLELDRLDVGLHCAFLPQPLRTGMCPLIGLFEPRGLYPSVDLRRGHTRMSEHLLDGPQIGPAVEQMRRERVPEGVRVDASLDRSVPRPYAQAPPYV